MYFPLRNLTNKVCVLMKKNLCFFALLLLLCLTGAHGYAAAPKLASQSACVLDEETGQILFQKNADRRMPPASITKIMTALVAMEEHGLKGSVTASEEALATVDLDSTRIGYIPGEKVSVKQLMYGMLIYSANDAANLLAQAVSGDVDTFVDKMNQKAKELGCTNTHFENPNGLDMDGHKTTARDMARIAYAAGQYPEIKEIAGTISFMLDADNVVSKKDRWTVYTKVDAIVPSNPLYNADVVAAKTGWTHTAHHTFVAYTSHEKHNLIVVTMNSLASADKYNDTKALINYCLSQPRTQVSVAEYEDAAQRAAHKADKPVSIESESLKKLSVRLPTGITADDLTFSVTENDNRSYLNVLISEDQAANYTVATGIDASQPLLTTQISTEPYSPLSLTSIRSGIGALSSSTKFGLLAMAAAAVFCLLFLLLIFSVHLSQNSKSARRRRRRKRDQRLAKARRRQTQNRKRHTAQTRRR